MCDKRNTRLISVCKRRFRIDGCLKDKIEKLNKKSVTVACCCGHGRYPETILIKTKDGKIKDINSGTIIPRKRNFYKKDKDGFFYIPEISEAKA